MISYGFYIYHDPALLLTQWATAGWRLAAFHPLVAFSLAVLAASLSHHYVEKPFLALKERLPAFRTDASEPGRADAQS